MKEGCSLLVRNLKYESSPAKIRRIFEEFGQVRDVYLPLDHVNKKPRGFGFIQFFDDRDAREAMRKLDRTKIDGNEVSVIVAQDRRKSPETMRRMGHDQVPRRGRGGDGGGNRRDHSRGRDSPYMDSRAHRDRGRRHRSRSRSVSRSGGGRRSWHGGGGHESDDRQNPQSRRSRRSRSPSPNTAIQQPQATTTSRSKSCPRDYSRSTSRDVPKVPVGGSVDHRRPASRSESRSQDHGHVDGPEMDGRMI
eukprot:GHVS01019900.1.p1 GENE.GHVS01019900.1~~GHVS01019900.1.p1  ORF type:complete len:249 (+),score=11.41 GHVS01019900.1:220-966(+)